MVDAPVSAARTLRFDMASTKVQTATETGLALFGSIVVLMSQSPAHRHLMMADMEWLVLPAIPLRQCRVFRARGLPVAYASWAFLSPKAEKKLLAPSPRLSPGDWNSGKRAWIVDLIAPKNRVDSVISALRRGSLAGQTVHLRLPGMGGRINTKIYEPTSECDDIRSPSESE
jgi:cytolysin-activating lysine-acyltransferase